MSQSKGAAIVNGSMKFYKYLLFLFLCFFGFIFISILFIGMVVSSDNSGSSSQSGVSETAKQEIPADLIPIYQKAAAQYHIPWEYLAAIHWMETKFGRTTKPGDPKRKSMTSSVGAIGPMQFMDLTWIGWGWANDHPGKATKFGDIPDKYGVDVTDCKLIAKYGGYGTDANGDGVCDPWNEVDAIFAAAKYLARNGMANGEIAKAIRAYNKSDTYVNTVMTKAKQYAVPVTGQNIVASDGQFIWPLSRSYPITSQFGMRFHPIKKTWKMHKGIDIAVPEGTPVYAAADGYATVKNDPDGYGLYVVIDHGNGYSTLYGHLSQTTGPLGYVKKGMEIGKSGKSGSATGPHLHFEVRINNIAQDPLNYVKQP